MYIQVCAPLRIWQTLVMGQAAIDHSHTATERGFQHCYLHTKIPLPDMPFLHIHITVLPISPCEDTQARVVCFVARQRIPLYRTIRARSTPLTIITRLALVIVGNWTHQNVALSAHEQSLLRLIIKIPHCFILQQSKLNNPLRGKIKTPKVQMLHRCSKLFFMQNNAILICHLRLRKFGILQLS